MENKPALPPALAEALDDLLRKLEPSLDPGKRDELATKVAAAVEDFRSTPSNPSDRDVRLWLRDVFIMALKLLYKLRSRNDLRTTQEFRSGVGRLRRHLKFPPERARQIMDERAPLFLNHVLPDLNYDDNVLQWFEYAPDDVLSPAVLALTAMGGKIETGRSRGKKGRDRPRFVPFTGPAKDGRPPKDTQFYLVARLVDAFARAFDRFPELSRSDETPVGAFVYAVFQYLGKDDGEAEYALRFFLEALEEAERTADRPGSKDNGVRFSPVEWHLIR